jgi:hypothetical protein
MGFDGDIKTSKFLKVVRKLVSRSALELSNGGKHNWKVKCIYSGETYPLPANHRIINKHLVHDFGKWLEKNQICTYDEYRELCGSL